MKVLLSLTPLSHPSSSRPGGKRMLLCCDGMKVPEVLREIPCVLASLQKKVFKNQSCMLK